MHWRQASKIRLTGLTGESNNPWCFKHAKKLPCCCRAQKKSWMDSQLFKEWGRGFHDQLATENWKVALIIDNCTAHPKVEV